MKEPREVKEARWTVVTARELRHTVVIIGEGRDEGLGREKECSIAGVAFNRMTFMKKPWNFFRCRTTTFLRDIVCSDDSKCTEPLRARRGNNARIFAIYDVNIEWSNDQHRLDIKMSYMLLHIMFS